MSATPIADMKKVYGYSMEDLDLRAGWAHQTLKDFTVERLADYETRRNFLRERGIPIIALLGHGRAGKDTAGEYLGQKLGLRYGGSSSTSLCKFVSDMTGIDETTAWNERHQHREFWIAAGHAVRRHDLSLLCKMALSLSDFAIGLRGRCEVYACMRAKVVDVSIWIDNPTVPVDPTVEFTSGDCDFSVTNHGSYFDLYRKLDRICELLRIEPVSTPRSV